jgi:hypothetical protein
VNLHPWYMVSGLTRDSLVSGLLCSEATTIGCVSLHRNEVSFRREIGHDVTAFHPLMEVKGITIMRLQRLHLSSSPCPRTFAISWPHSQRVSLQSVESSMGEAVRTIIKYISA